MNKFKDLKVGDVLESGKYKLTVLDKFTQSCIVEYSDDSSGLYSFKELEKNGFEIVKPEWRVDVEGQEYWYIGDDGVVSPSKWDSRFVDKFRLKSKNCFETKKLAEEHYKKVWKEKFNK